MFLNDFQYFMYIYIGESQMGHICPMLANQYQKYFQLFFIYLFLNTYGHK